MEKDDMTIEGKKFDYCTVLFLTIILPNAELNSGILCVSIHTFIYSASFIQL